jgi:hypothetical protein
MKLMRSTTLAAALAIVALSATQAAAQAPTVTWQQIGNGVRVQWNALSGATHYEAVINGVEAGIPIPTNFFQVSPVPPGNYTVQIRGAAGAAKGPLSAPVTVVITAGGGGGGGCITPSVPALSASANGMQINASWSAVAGAVGYRIQVGRSPGATEFQQDLSGGQTSYSNTVPFIGTFYVRVHVGNACGTVATSNEVAVTVGAQTPGPAAPTTPSAGPRTPDPAAGQLIPRASLGYLRTVVETMANQYRGDLLNSCATHTWVYRVVAALRQIDTRWGLNYKRGWNGDMSHDIVAYNPTNRPDEGESQVYLFDIIANHCPISGSPGPNWTDVTDPTWAARGNPACGAEWCARWTLVPYLRAGFADSK